MSTPALLLLAHQARSYASMIKPYLDRLGLVLAILSSRPRDRRDLEQIAAVGGATLWQVDDDYLDDTHVTAILARARDEGLNIVAVLATFEGYRLLMAETNARLGALDARPEAVRNAMDKLRCRAALHDAGLSPASASVLDASSLEPLRTSGRRLFVKPRRCAGSFACFRLDDTVTVQRLARLREQMQSDQAFRAIFAGQYDFIAEDYLTGDEYSFEVIAAAGHSYVVGVHAKYVDETTGTTLEMGNSLPAPRLSDTQQLAGERFIDACLATLRLSEGCYHIETRYDAASDHWDIIEINTRMGGALINQSVGVFTNGISMLELWVRTLCCPRADRDAWRTQLAALRESTRRASGALTQGAVFLSRYGERNRTLEALTIDALVPPPDVADLPVRPNTKLPDSERGIFILNALWKVPISRIEERLSALSAMLDEKLVVRYSDVAGLDADTTSQEKP